MNKSEGTNSILKWAEEVELKWRKKKGSCEERIFPIVRYEDNIHHHYIKNLNYPNTADRISLVDGLVVLRKNGSVLSNPSPELVSLEEYERDAEYNTFLIQNPHLLHEINNDRKVDDNEILLCPFREFKTKSGTWIDLASNIVNTICHEFTRIYPYTQNGIELTLFPDTVIIGFDKFSENIKASTGKSRSDKSKIYLERQKKKDEANDFISSRNIPFTWEDYIDNDNIDKLINTPVPYPWTAVMINKEMKNTAIRIVCYLLVKLCENGELAKIVYSKINKIWRKTEAKSTDCHNSTLDGISYCDPKIILQIVLDGHRLQPTDSDSLMKLTLNEIEKDKKHYHTLGICNKYGTSYSKYTESLKSGKHDPRIDREVALLESEGSLLSPKEIYDMLPALVSRNILTMTPVHLTLLFDENESVYNILTELKNTKKTELKIGENGEVFVEKGPYDPNIIHRIRRHPNVKYMRHRDVVESFKNSLHAKEKFTFKGKWETNETHATPSKSFADDMISDIGRYSFDRFEPGNRKRAQLSSTDPKIQIDQLSKTVFRTNLKPRTQRIIKSQTDTVLIGDINPITKDNIETLLRGSQILTSDYPELTADQTMYMKGFQDRVIPVFSFVGKSNEVELIHRCAIETYPQLCPRHLYHFGENEVGEFDFAMFNFLWEAVDQIKKTLLILPPYYSRLSDKAQQFIPIAYGARLVTVDTDAFIHGLSTVEIYKEMFCVDLYLSMVNTCTASVKKYLLSKTTDEPQPNYNYTSIVTQCGLIYNISLVRSICKDRFSSIKYPATTLAHTMLLKCNDYCENFIPKIGHSTYLETVVKYMSDACVSSEKSGMVYVNDIIIDSSMTGKWSRNNSDGTLSSLLIPHNCMRTFDLKCLRRLIRQINEDKKTPSTPFEERIRQQMYILYMLDDASVGKMKSLATRTVDVSRASEYNFLVVPKK